MGWRQARTDTYVVATSLAAAPSPPRAAAPAPVGAGRRLMAGIQALEDIPALAEARDRLVDLGAKPTLSSADVTTVVEGDVGLTIRVLRAANRRFGADRDRVATVARAVDALSPETVVELAAHAPALDFLAGRDRFGGELERLRLHGVATQRAAELLRAELDLPGRDELMVSALLHDIGKLVLGAADGDYGARADASGTPERRVEGERRELGLDHAVIGGVVARRWRLPNRIASAIELHHAADARGEAGVVRLADMLVHYARGAAVSSSELLGAASLIGLERRSLRRLMHDLPYPEARPSRPEPCPLTRRELDVVKGLARGEVYKTIGHRLALSTSTIRTHLHNAYGKLGVEDRAQAVLVASARGWI